MGRFQLLEHTADMGIEATGATLADLFAAAADGLRAILSDHPPRFCEDWQKITVRGATREELLVNWLNEILYRMEVEGLFPERFRVEEISATHLSASICGTPLGPRIPPPDREVKAVTWHRLEIGRVQKGWRAQLYLDL